MRNILFLLVLFAAQPDARADGPCSPEVVPTAYGFEVTATGDPLLDPVNIQCAIDHVPLDGAVMLKAGTFNFDGQGSLARYKVSISALEAVTIDRPLTLTGEMGDGTHLTRIHRGTVPVGIRSAVGSGDVIIRDIWFDESNHIAVAAMGGHNIEFSNLLVTDVTSIVEGRTLVPGWTRFRIPLVIAAMDGLSITGNATVNHCHVEGQVDLGVGHEAGIQITSGLEIEAVDNTSIGYSSFRVGGPVTNSAFVEGNTITGALRGMVLRSRVSMDVLDNEVIMVGAQRFPGIQARGPGEFLLSDNELTMSAASQVGILFDRCPNAAVTNNALTGTAASGIELFGSSGGVVQGNNLATLDYADHLVFLDGTSNANVLVGFSGCQHGDVADNGTDNMITGCEPMTGGVGSDIAVIRAEGDREDCEWDGGVWDPDTATCDY